MKKYFLLFVCIIATQKVFSQTETGAAAIVRDANDLATGNAVNAFTSYYKVALKNFTGKEKTLQFESSLLAIRARTNPALWTDKEYLRHTFARNFNAGIDLKLDSLYKFTGSNITLKYAVLNKRDKSVYDFNIPDELAWITLKRNILNQIAADSGVTSASFKKAQHFLYPDAAGVPIKVADMGVAFQTLYKKISDTSAQFKNYSLTDFANYGKNKYDAIAKIVEKKPLWTVGAKFSSAANNILFSAVQFNTEFLKGFTKLKAPVGIEISLSATDNFMEDTTSAEQDINRNVASATGGFNFSLRNIRTDKSMLEVKLTASVNYIAQGLYKGEAAESYTLNGAVWFRLSNDMWIPFEFKYNPNTKKVVGTLNLDINFDLLKKIAGE